MRGTMELIDPYTGRMRCKVCGAEHCASIKPRSGGRCYYGSWQCVFKDQHPITEATNAEKQEQPTTKMGACEPGTGLRLAMIGSLEMFMKDRAVDAAQESIA